MEHSENIADLSVALVKAQAEMENATNNAFNPHFKNKYADLAEFIRTVRPMLNKHGLAVVQIPGYEDGVVTLDTMMVHTSGQWIRGVSGTPVPKKDPQGVGSGLTYLRRYSLAALCGIAQEDDDGKAAGGSGDAITKEQAATLGEWMDTTETDPAEFAAYLNVSSVADLPAGRYDEALNALKAKDRKRKEAAA